MEAIRIAEKNKDKPNEKEPVNLREPVNEPFEQPTLDCGNNNEVVIENCVLPIMELDLINYEVVQLQPVGMLYTDEFFIYDNFEKIKSQIIQVLHTESPISKNLLCKRVLNAWGIYRLGSRINIHFQSLFNQLEMEAVISGGNEYFWENGQSTKEYRNFRIANQESQKRDADDLPPEEVANGIMHVLKNQISLPKADLVREGAKLFGYARIGTNVEIKMLSGIQKAIDNGFARFEGDRIIYNES